MRVPFRYNVYNFMNRLPWLFLICLLAGCGSAPKPATTEKKAPEAPAEPVTGRYAMNQMYITARAWATDLTPLSLTNIPLAKYPQKDGKAMAWQAVFVSASQQKARTYTYSAVDAGSDASKGVSAGAPEAYTQQATADPFPMAALQKDSDTAYEVAMKHSADYRKKYPDMLINLRVEKTREFPDPAWRVYWGDSIATSGFSVYVDASTGDFLRTGR